ncbi:nucleoside triphosphate pyrophosphohydrolase family protein [Pseudidiomarina gelatinasegens]|uniref:nucleoside triphosphate pyrophosphohydrolase family protein n=1 Tax=Pseudidiomarina gelatinasegens TaxID=2487740 RepID=UPI0030EF897D|tara:strand:- start:4283 stop:5164 length:882 start_codon:yes stop_codon:yes gene_type:complete
MELDEYQKLAIKAARFEIADTEGRIISLLGLAGEVGELSTEFKKQIRDGKSYKIFKNKVIEELGDILWYLASISSVEGLSLESIAKANLKKIESRTPQRSSDVRASVNLLDDSFPPEEQIPRVFDVAFVEKVDRGNLTYIQTMVDGKEFGNPLRDNHYEDDGYRYHDIFHFSFAAILGWSPVVRKFFQRKRVSNPVTDEVEDGGRAIVIDEAISALVFEYAKKHSYLEDIDTIDFSLLRTIKELTSHLEVSVRTHCQWERAILIGFEIWREIKDKKVGKVHCDLISGDIRIVN